MFLVWRLWAESIIVDLDPESDDSFMVASNDRRHDSNGVEHIRVRYEYAIQDFVAESWLMPSLFHQILVGQLILIDSEHNMCPREIKNDLLDARFNVLQ